jgi:hypothetical protein
MRKPLAFAIIQIAAIALATVSAFAWVNSRGVVSPSVLLADKAKIEARITEKNGSLAISPLEDSQALIKASVSNGLAYGNDLFQRATMMVHLSLSLEASAPQEEESLLASLLSSGALETSITPLAPDQAGDLPGFMEEFEWKEAWLTDGTDLYCVLAPGASAELEMTVSYNSDNYQAFVDSCSESWMFSLAELTGESLAFPLELSARLDADATSYDQEAIEACFGLSISNLTLVKAQ